MYVHKMPSIPELVDIQTLVIEQMLMAKNYFWLGHSQPFLLQVNSKHH